jgi:hypothetical protein
MTAIATTDRAAAPRRQHCSSGRLGHARFRMILEIDRGFSVGRYRSTGEPGLGAEVSVDAWHFPLIGRP